VVATEGVAWSLANHDLEDAFQWAAQLEDPDLLEAATVRISKVAAVKDPQSGVEWATQLPEGALRDQVFQFAMQRWAHCDLEAAADWASSSGEESAELAVPAIAKAMAAQEPAKAADWVMQWEDPEIRLSTLQNLTQHWAAREPVAARSWARSLSPGSVRDFVDRLLESESVWPGSATAESAAPESK
jgi:hypothetical protein